MSGLLNPALSLVSLLPRYCPTVCILKPRQLIHINKGRIHAFRKLSTYKLPKDDCHATLRAELVEKENLVKEELCISVAWDWMYRGVTEGGIGRELSAAFQCAELNRIKGIKSLGIPEVSLLHLARSICDEKPPTAESPFQPTPEVICRGILPGLRDLVHLLQEARQVAGSKVKSVVAGGRKMDLLDIVHRTDAGQDPSTTPIAPYGKEYTCRFCSRELSNIYCHCNGCEDLLLADFNLCVFCHAQKKHKSNVTMQSTGGELHSGHHHTGGFWNTQCYCKASPRSGNCSVCAECARCCCRCHSNFSVHCRFFNEEDENRLLRRVEKLGADRPDTYAERYEAGEDTRRCALWPICLEDASVCGGLQGKYCRCYQELLKELPTDEQIRTARTKFNGTEAGRYLLEATKRRYALKRQKKRQNTSK